MASPPRRRSAGSVALSKIGETGKQMAVRTGTTPQLVSNWRQGQRVPGPEWRAILRNLYAIPVEAWDAPVPSGGFLDKVSQSPAPVTQLERVPACTGEVPSSSLGGGSNPQPLDPVRYAQEIAGRLDALLKEYDTATMVTVVERGNVLEKCTKLLEKLYNATAMSEAKIFASPAWGRIRARLVAALPVESLAEVEAALRVAE